MPIQTFLFAVCQHAPSDNAGHQLEITDGQIRLRCRYNESRLPGAEELTEIIDHALSLQATAVEQLKRLRERQAKLKVEASV